jgi:hypothetical protein
VLNYATKDLRDKADNNPRALKAKVDIRQRVLEAVREQSSHTAVFDAFAGSGQMYSSVWCHADSYVGVDLKWARDERLMFAADNKRVLRAVDLAPFNICDLDSHGSPWEQAIIIADRRRVAPGEIFGIVLTEGTAFAYQVNVVPAAIRVLTGLKPGIVGLGRKQDSIIDRAIAGLANRMRCTVVKRWQAASDAKARMRYIGLVLRGNGG